MSWSHNLNINLNINLNVFFCFQQNFQELFLLFIPKNYSLFHNIIMLNIFTDQPIVKIIVVAETRSIFSLRDYEPIQNSII